MELKNTAKELHEAYTWIDQTEEQISEIEDPFNEIKHKDKIRENIIGTNKASNKYRTMWKDQTYI